MDNDPGSWIPASNFIVAVFNRPEFLSIQIFLQSFPRTVVDVHFYGLSLDVPPKSHAVISGVFSEVSGSSVCDAGIDQWCYATVKGTRIKGVSIIYPK